LNYLRGELVLLSGDSAGLVYLAHASEIDGSVVTIKMGSTLKYRRTYYVE